MSLSATIRKGWQRTPPAASRCPRCLYLPASATVICALCSHDTREAFRAPNPRAHTRKTTRP
jgi:hypothetical protein